MGIIIRQSFWTSILAYIGVAIGFVNSLILFPAFLSTEQIGLLRQLQSGALMLVPLATLGISATTVKFHPRFQDEAKTRNAFFTLMLGGAMLGFLLNWLLITIFQQQVTDYFASKSALVNDYFYIIIILLAILSLTAVFESYLRARFNIIFTNFVNGVMIRLVVGLFVVLFGIGMISFDLTAHGLIIAYGSGLLLLGIYAYRTDPFGLRTRLGTAIRTGLKEIGNYSLFSILGTAGNVILLNIDILMVTGLAGLSQTGIYTTAFYIGLVIEMPRRAISQISIPLISRAMNEKDLETVRSFYRKVSINQLIIGAVLYLGVITNLENIYSMIPNNENFIAGMPVVYIIGLAKLTDMAFGQNSAILMFSKYYRFNVLTVIILGVLTILFNYLLIPVYGIIGAAYASLAAILLYNLVKLFFIRLRFGIYPFTHRTLITLGLGIVTFLIIDRIPYLNHVILDILVRSVLVLTLFALPVYLLRISPEINDQVRNFLDRFRNQPS